MVAFTFVPARGTPAWVEPAGWVQAQAATVHDAADTLAWELTPLLRTQGAAEAAADVVLRHLPADVQPYCPWLPSDLPDGGDPDPMLSEALGWAALARSLAGLQPVLDRTAALALAQTHLAVAQGLAARVRQSARGAARGAAQTAMAAAWWAPWVREYRALRGGLTPAKARATVVAMMIDNGVTLPSTGEFPSPKVLRERLAG